MRLRKRKRHTCHRRIFHHRHQKIEDHRYPKPPQKSSIPAPHCCWKQTNHCRTTMSPSLFTGNVVVARLNLCSLLRQNRSHHGLQGSDIENLAITITPFVASPPCLRRVTSRVRYPITPCLKSIFFLTVIDSFFYFSCCFLGMFNSGFGDLRVSNTVFDCLH